MFHALVSGRVDGAGIGFEVEMLDIEALNQRALAEASSPPLPITKVSAGVLGSLSRSYVVLGAGAAMGRGVGPLVVARPDRGIESLADLVGKRIAVPGLRTTACRLLEMFAPGAFIATPLRFDGIVAAVSSGEFDAGLIIHESRFTYAQQGLLAVADMGQLWERETDLPLPLGVIVAQRELGAPRLQALERGIAQSVQYARRDPAASADYVRQHAQEMSPAVCQQHIDLYVNEFSIEMGAEGRRAIDLLLAQSAVSQGRPAPSSWFG